MYKLRLVSIFLILNLCFLGSVPELASSDTLSSDFSFTVEEWNTSNGLQTDYIKSVIQTDDGYLWMLTTRGVLRFDGLEFETFSLEPEHDDVGYGFYKQESGGLWIITRNGFWKYSGRRFSYILRDDIKNSLPGLSEAEISTERLLLFPDDNGFFSFVYPEHLSQADISALYLDSQHAIWAGSKRQGLWIFANETAKPKEVADLFRDLQVLSIVEGRQGNYWIGTDGGLYMVWNPFNAQNPVKRKYSVSDGLSSDQIQAVLEDRRENIWVGTELGLDRIYHTSNGQIHIENQLKNMDVLDLFEDREGSIWIGTSSSGLKCLKETVFRTYTASDKESSDHFTSLLEDSKGNVWAGTRYGDLFLFRNDRFKRIQFETDIFDKMMFTMTEDRQGCILFGTEHKGVFIYENERVRPYIVEDGPIAGTIVTLFEDNRSRLWVGQYGKQLGFYENGSYVPFLTNQEYPGKMVFSIIEDRENNLWIGGTEGVIFLPKGNPNKKNIRWLLKGIPVHSLLEDNSGKILIGTSENGLICLHPQTFVSIKVTEDEGLRSNHVFQILQDDRNYLWMTTYQGIMRIQLNELDALAENKKEKINCTLFGLSDGLDASAFYGLKTKQNRLLFATKRGIAEAKPESVCINPVPPTVHIYKIIQNGKTQKIDNEEEKSLKIKSRSHLDIHFKVVTLKGQENIQAKYRLDGWEDKWTFLPNAPGRIVTYTDLPPGRYIFHITASNNHGIWNNEGASLIFQVVPLFFQTQYFKIFLLVIFLAGAGLLAFRVNKKRQKRKNKYWKTRLPDDQAEQYKQKLLLLLEKDKIYRDSSLSIQTLSRRLSLPAYHLSQVINEKLKKNFYELINGYRIEESKELMADDNEKQTKILAIAYEVGFNTLNSFNRAFKRHTGKTPTEYRNGSQNKMIN